MTEIFDVSDKTVFITGASSGIGAYMVALFATSGSNVVLAARRMEKLTAVVDEIVDFHKIDRDRFLVIEMDITDRAAVENGVTEAAARFGGIDVLMNNAGIAKTARLLEMTEDQ